jgi:hypothetical protein
VADASLSDVTLVTGAATAVPELLSQTRVLAAVVEEMGFVRSRTRLLGDDVAAAVRDIAATHREVLARQLDARARDLAKRGVTEMLDELAAAGFAWRDLAAIVGVSVPAMRRWRQGEPPTGPNRLAIARLLALVEMLRDDHQVADVASWMEVPLAEGSPLTPIDLAKAARFEDVVDVAAGHATGDQVLDVWQPDWRRRYSAEFEVFEAPDGEMATRARASGSNRLA